MHHLFIVLPIYRECLMAFSSAFVLNKLKKKTKIKNYYEYEHRAASFKTVIANDCGYIKTLYMISYESVNPVTSA